MNFSVMAAVLGVAVLVTLVVLFNRHGDKLARLVYQKRTALFSADDRQFYRVLRQVVAGEFEVFGKIRVADIVSPKKSVVPHGGNSKGLNPVAGRHFDFVLCDATSLNVVCTIQLHDKTNPAQQAELQDDVLKAVCDSVGLPLVRFAIKAEYSVDEIRDKLKLAMSKEPLFLMESDGRKEPRISNIEDLKI
jgi:hypothetical protein